MSYIVVSMDGNVYAESDRAAALRMCGDPYYVVLEVFTNPGSTPSEVKTLNSDGSASSISSLDFMKAGGDGEEG